MTNSSSLTLPCSISLMKLLTFGSRHRNCILQLLQIGPQTRIQFLRSWWERTRTMKPTIFAIHSSIKTIHPPLGCWLLECTEVSHFLETVSISSLSYYRQHPSALSVLFGLDEYGEYFFLRISLFHYISKERHFHSRSQDEPVTLLGVASTPILGVLSAGSDISLVGSLLRPVPSIQVSSQR